MKTIKCVIKHNGYIIKINYDEKRTRYKIIVEDQEGHLLIMTYAFTFSQAETKALNSINEYLIR